MRLQIILITISYLRDLQAGYIPNPDIQRLYHDFEKQDLRYTSDFQEEERSWQSSITSPNANEITNCSLNQDLVDEIRSYQDVVNQIITYVTEGEYKGQTYNTLAELADTFGPRMTGSAALEDAIDYLLDWSATEGLENIHTEDVVVPHWERNNESAWMVLPRLHKLNMLGLGESIGTPPEGIRADVLVVRDFDDLAQNAALAAGRIVVYNLNFTSYGAMSVYRARGSAEAASVGAVASLMSSLASFSINSPHTGTQSLSVDDILIPAGAISIEDAAMMARMQERGETIEVLLTMGAINYPATTSRNGIIELGGSEIPQETVLVSGHIDSWDVGQGAMDDGGGVMISWNAAVVLKKLGLRPRRTLRVILFTAEEQGLIGGRAYFNNHETEKDNFQLVMESDGGTFNPYGLGFTGNVEATCIMQEIMQLLEPLNITRVVFGGGGGDIGDWTRAGVPSGSPYVDGEKYFWFHHSDGDTMSVEDPDVLDRCLALWTAVAYVTADMSQRLPHTPVRN